MSTNFRQYIEAQPDFPKPGVLYWDFTPLLTRPDIFAAGIADLSVFAEKYAPTTLAAVEAKGFLLGGALSGRLSLPLVLIRKAGLTPGKTVRRSFAKEYGCGEYEIKADVLGARDRVLLLYDILAAPGATQAAVALIESQGAQVVAAAYVIELAYLAGRQGIPSLPIYSLVRIAEPRATENPGASR